MTGWRLGYIGAPASIAAACSKIQGQFTSGANAFAQKAAATALLSDMSPSFAMRDEFLRRRGIITEALSQIEGMQVNHPNGAFYIFPDISAFFGKAADGFTITNSGEFCEYLLQQAHVACVAGAAFGAPNCFRISYAASEEDLREAVKRIAAACKKLA
jgi:aspartate aminotransferase